MKLCEGVLARRTEGVSFIGSMQGNETAHGRDLIAVMPDVKQGFGSTMIDSPTLALYAEELRCLSRPG